MSKTSRFLSQNQDKIVLIIGAILICAIGFAAGRLTAQPQPEPITIEEPEANLSYTQEKGNVLGQKEQTTVEELKEDKSSKEADFKEGKYVGSKNSKKYHYPDCRYAQKIKKENQIWFKSAKEARESGYQPCGVCKPPTND